MAAKSAIRRFSSKSLTKLNLIAVAVLGRPHGVRGGLNIHKAGEHLSRFIGKPVLIGNLQMNAPYTLARLESDRVQFEEISDRDAAAKLTNQSIFVPIEALRAIAAADRGKSILHIGDLWYFELIDFVVLDAETQQSLGKISGVSDMGLNTLVTIEPEPGSLLASSMEIPLDYPQWQVPDLGKNQISLSDWRIFLE